MGVQGWNWLLQQEGFLPDRANAKCCSCSLWRDSSAIGGTSVASRTNVIPRGSELHIDGNGLAFFLHRVAYARHLSQVLAGGRSDSAGNDKPGFNHSGNIVWEKTALSKKRLSKLSSSQARRLLPNFMPMQLLSDVTREFVTQLRDKHQMKLRGARFFLSLMYIRDW